MKSKSLKNKRILITGADGFIGSHLAKRLLAEGAEIHAFVLENFSAFRIQDIFDRINLWPGDLRCVDTINKCLKGCRPEIVIHLASLKNVTRDPALIEAMYDVNVRPFLTYGPTQDTSLFIPSLIKHCLWGKDFKMTRGEQTREFNYVTDIAEGFVLVAQAENVIGEIINLGNSWEYKIKDVAQKIVEFMGNVTKLDLGAFPYRPGEAMRFFSSSEKAKKLLGWVPKVNLDEGLEKTITWYKQNKNVLL